MKLTYRCLLLSVGFFLVLLSGSAEGIPLRPERDQSEFQSFIQYSHDYYKDICLFGNDPCSELGLSKYECYLDKLFPCSTSDALQLPMKSSELSYLEAAPATKEEFLSWLATELDSADTEQQVACSDKSFNFQQSS